jgi:hypothetical protein
VGLLQCLRPRRNGGPRSDRPPLRFPNTKKYAGKTPVTFSIQFLLRKIFENIVVEIKKI